MKAVHATQLFAKRTTKMFSALLATTVLFALTACGGSTTVGGDTPAPIDTAASGAFPTPNGGEVHVYNWTDYLATDEIARFEKETGIKVVLDVYDSNETMLAKLQSGATGYDVIFPSDYMVSQMRELNMLQEVNVASFPNAKNIKPAFMDVYWDQGRKYTAPYMYGTTGIICATSDPECERIQSWKDFFTSTSPKMGTLKDQVEIVSAALRATGVAANDLCTTDKAKYAAAQDLLRSFKPQVIESDGSLERLISGTSTVVQAWNGEAHRFHMEKKATRYIYPTEGLNEWADNIAIPVGAPNVDNAKIFMNWLMDPKNIAVESNYTGYDNSITGSADYMDEAMKTDPAVIPPADALTRLSPTPNCNQDVRALYTQVFQDWLASQ